MRNKIIALILTLALSASLLSIVGLIPASAADTSALDAEITAAKVLLNKGYGEQSRKYLADRVERAEAVLFDEAAPQEKVDAALDALRAAEGSLAQMYGFALIGMTGVSGWDEAALAEMNEYSSHSVDTENKPDGSDFSVSVSGDGSAYISNSNAAGDGIIAASPFGTDLTRADGFKLWISVGAPAEFDIRVGSSDMSRMYYATFWADGDGYVLIPFDAFSVVDGVAVNEDADLGYLCIGTAYADSFRFADLNAYDEIIEGSTRTAYSETKVVSRNQIKSNSYYKIIEPTSGKAITLGPEVAETAIRWDNTLAIEDSNLKYSLEENREGDRTQMWQLSPSPSGNGAFRVINKSSTNALTISGSGGSVEAREPNLNDNLQEWSISISGGKTTIQVRNVGKLTTAGDTVKATTGTTYKKFELYETVETEYVQSWSDEFDGDKLDRTKWSVDDGFWFGGSVTTIHTDDEGDQLKVSDGMLNLTATPGRYGSNEFKGTYMNTSGRFAFSYGKIEIRAKLAYGNGQFPAFWMMPTDMMNMGGGEIDIMEMSITDDIRKNGEQIGTIHWTSDNGATHWSKVYYMPIYGYGEAYQSDDFHTYGIEMDRDQVRYYFDGMQYMSLVLNSDGKRFAFGDMARYIIINNSTKGDGNNTINYDWGLEEKYETQIDYVRCFLEAGEMSDNTVDFTTEDSTVYSAGIDAVGTEDAWDMNFPMDIKPDGTEGAAADHLSNIYIFDPVTNVTKKWINIDPTVRALRVLYSPDGTKLVVATTQGNILIYDTSDYSKSPRRITNGCVIQENVVFTKDSSAIIVGGFNGGSQKYSPLTEKWCFRVFNATTGTKLQEINVGSDPRFIAISDDGSKVAVTTTSNGTFLYDTSDWSELGHITEGHTGAIRGADFSSDGKLLVTSDDKGVVNVYNVDDLTLRNTINNVNSGSVRRVVFSPDDKNLLCTSTYGAARLFNASTGELVSLLGGFGNVVREATYSPDGKFIVVAAYGGGAKVFAADGTYLETLKAGEKDENDEGYIISRIKFPPDSRFVFFSTRTAPKSILKWPLPCETDKTALNETLASLRPSFTREYQYAAKVASLKYATPRMVSKAYYDLLAVSPLPRNTAAASADGYSFGDSASIMRGGYVYVMSDLAPAYENIAVKVSNNADGSYKYFYPDKDTLIDERLVDSYSSVRRVMKLKLLDGGEYTASVVNADTDEVLASCAVSVDGERTTTDDFLYSVNTEKEEVTILRCISGDRDIVIPNELEGYPVTAIGSFAFSGYGTNVAHMTVKLPDTLKTIGSYAFSKCWSLREIEFPASLTNIAANAFKDCRLLAVVDVPAGTTVSGNAFAGAGVGTIRLHTVTGVSGGAFTGTGYRVREIIFEDGIQTISNFNIGKQLLIEAVYIPESVTSISGTFFNHGDIRHKVKLYGHPDTYAQTYAEQYPDVYDFVPIADPVVADVEEGKTYDLKTQQVSFTWEDGHVAYLNGDVVNRPCDTKNIGEYRPFEITEPGEYELKVINGYDEYTTTVHFTVVDTTLPYTYGDVDDDGEVTVTDALAALRIALGITEPEGYQAQAADVDKDGEVTVSDVLRILRVAAKLDDPFEQ